MRVWSAVLTLAVGFALLVPHGLGQDAEPDLKELKKQLRSKVVEVRLRALKDIAALGIEADEPPKEVAEALALGLRDGSYPVRGEAARLLSQDQNLEVAVRALAAALKAAQSEGARYLGRGPFGGVRAADAEKEGNERAQAALKAANEWLDFVHAVAEGLAGLPDDRSVAALTGFLRKLPPRPPGRVANPLVDALAALDCRASVDALIDYLSVSIASASAARPQGRKGRAAIALHVHEALTVIAKGRNLEGAPRTEDPVKLPSLWKKWWTRNAKHFPARLGRIEAQAD